MIPNPPTEYLAAQAALVQLLSEGRPNGSIYSRPCRAYHAKCRLQQKKMIRLFSKAFGLVEVPLFRSYYRVKLAAGPKANRLFDHVSFFRPKDPPRDLRIICQPYADWQDIEDAVRRITTVSCSFRDLTPWAWYYPGRAGCFEVITPSQVLKRLSYR